MTNVKHFIGVNAIVVIFNIIIKSPQPR
jgi:hypothetical protein